MPCKVVVAVSDESEQKMLQDKFEGNLSVYIGLHPNNPLGAKWQYAADVAIKLGADPVIPIGSDDLFCKNYIENICALLEKKQVEFIGINMWWLHDVANDILYKLSYIRKDFPLGGGRAYTRKMIYALGGVLFDKSKDKHLDDLGWHSVTRSKLDFDLLQDAHARGLDIISIKGNWPVMNSADAILAAKQKINKTLISADGAEYISKQFGV
jgi:hypothetical protein